MPSSSTEEGKGIEDTNGAQIAGKRELARTPEKQTEDIDINETYRLGEADLAFGELLQTNRSRSLDCVARTDDLLSHITQ